MALLLIRSLAAASNAVNSEFKSELSFIDRQAAVSSTISSLIQNWIVKNFGFGVNLTRSLAEATAIQLLLQCCTRVRNVCDLFDLFWQ